MAVKVPATGFGLNLLWPTRVPLSAELIPAEHTPSQLWDIPLPANLARRRSYRRLVARRQAEGLHVAIALDGFDDVFLDADAGILDTAEGRVLSAEAGHRADVHCTASALRTVFGRRGIPWVGRIVDAGGKGSRDPDSSRSSPQALGFGPGSASWGNRAKVRQARKNAAKANAREMAAAAVKKSRKLPGGLATSLKSMTAT